MQKIINMQIVSRLNGKEFYDDGTMTLKEKVVGFFNSFGNVVNTKEIGAVTVNLSSFRDDKGHGLTRNKVISFQAIPDVLSNGYVIDFYTPIDKPYERITIAAPIEIANEKYYMGVMVQRDHQSNRMYLHDVITEKATLSFNTEPTVDNDEGIRDKGHLYITSILQKALKVNSNERNSRFPKKMALVGRILKNLYLKQMMLGIMMICRLRLSLKRRYTAKMINIYFVITISRFLRYQLLTITGSSSLLFFR